MFQQCVIKKKDLICTLEIQIIVLHNLVYRLQFFVLVFFLAGETKLEAMSRSTIKRNIEGPDERLRGSSGVQPLVSPLSNRMILPQAAKANMELAQLMVAILVRVQLWLAGSSPPLQFLVYSGCLEALLEPK